jgi:hypothetical protein
VKIVKVRVKLIVMNVVVEVKLIAPNVMAVEGIHVTVVMVTV